MNTPVTTNLIAIGALLLIGVLPLLWAIGAYQRLALLRKRAKEAFVQVDQQIKQRYELIPQLVKVAKIDMVKERATLEALLAARNSAASAAQAAAADSTSRAAITQLAHAEDALAGALTRFFALASAYPQLQAVPAMTTLTEQLVELNDKALFARQSFNEAVNAYNAAIDQPPAHWLAAIANFKPATPIVAHDASV